MAQLFAADEPPSKVVVTTSSSVVEPSFQEEFDDVELLECPPSAVSSVASSLAELDSSSFAFVVASSADLEEFAAVGTAAVVVGRLKE